MNLLKFHALIYEIIYEKVLKLVLIPNDISCMIHGSLTSSVWQMGKSETIRR